MVKSIIIKYNNSPTKIPYKPFDTLGLLLVKFCNKKGLNSDNFRLKHDRKGFVDLQNPFRLSGLNNNCVLHLVRNEKVADVNYDEKEGGKKKKKKIISLVKVGLILSTGKRYIMSVVKDSTLWNMLHIFELECQISVLNRYNQDGFFIMPTLLIMRKKYDNIDELRGLTLSRIGVKSGSISIKLIMKDSKLKKDDIDLKNVHYDTVDKENIDRKAKKEQLKKVNKQKKNQNSEFTICLDTLKQDTGNNLEKYQVAVDSLRKIFKKIIQTENEVDNKKQRARSINMENKIALERFAGFTGAVTLLLSAGFTLVENKLVLTAENEDAETLKNVHNLLNKASVSIKKQLEKVDMKIEKLKNDKLKNDKKNDMKPEKNDVKPEKNDMKPEKNDMKPEKKNDMEPEKPKPKQKPKKPIEKDGKEMQVEPSSIFNDSQQSVFDDDAKYSIFDDSSKAQKTGKSIFDKEKPKPKPKPQKKKPKDSIFGRKVQVVNRLNISSGETVVKRVTRKESVVDLKKMIAALKEEVKEDDDYAKALDLLIIIAANLLKPASSPQAHKKRRKLDLAKDRLKKTLGRWENALKALHFIGYVQPTVEGSEIWDLPKEREDEVLIDRIVYILKRLRTETVVEKVVIVARNLKMFAPDRKVEKIEFNEDDDYTKADLRAIKMAQRDDLIKQRKIQEQASKFTFKGDIEKEKKKNARKYKHTVIRVHFPDNTLMQINFNPRENVSELFKEINAVMIEELPFYLINPPLPAIKLEKLTPQDTFKKMGLVPAGLLKLKFKDPNTQFFFKKEITFTKDAVTKEAVPEAENAKELERQKRGLEPTRKKKKPNKSSKLARLLKLQGRS